LILSGKVESSRMRTALIFSEEYVKVTKGLFVVWMSHAREAAKARCVDILLNHEHWAFAEAVGASGGAAQVSVHRLPFGMPSTWLRRALPGRNRPFALRAIGYVLGQALDLALSPLIIFVLYRRLRQISPAAVFSHSGGWPAGALCRWIIIAARIAQVPTRILIIHSHPMQDTNALSSALLAPFRFLRAWVIGWCATSIVAVSDSVRGALESEVFHRPVARIHNGIDPLVPESVPGRRAGPLEWHPSGLVVGFVGALHPMKGAHVLLDAFRSVNLPCELALLGPAAGHPDYVGSLHQRAHLCANRVSFLGFRDDVDGFMQRIDVLVVPAIAFESFGMVILEAMKHKKPVICTDFGGMKEVVEDGVSGLVVTAGDALALSNAMVKLLTDGNARHQMGEAGYRRLNSLFTSERMCEQYDSLIVDQ